MKDHLPVASERLILRRLRASDTEAFHAYRSDPEVAEYQGWDPMSEEESQAFLEQKGEGAFFQPNEWFQLGIALGDTDTLIGDIGACINESGASAEIGYSVNRQYQGQGYGTEAVRLAARYLFSNTGIEEIVAVTDARNLPSRRVLENLGMTLRETQKAEYKGEVCDEHIFVMKR